jgi:isoamylase
MYHAPLLWNIEFSDVLRTTLICEAWDAAGLYQVGDFPGFRWAEWNGRYRDTVRRFVRGDAGLRASSRRASPAAATLCETPGAARQQHQLRHLPRRLHAAGPGQLQRKHNEANGEDNRDGSDDNWSWNSGAEGPWTMPGHQRAARAPGAQLHRRCCMLSQGVPMLLAGDEVLRTQRGNNNAYCQDNETAGSTGRWSNAMPTCCASRAD